MSQEIPGVRYAEVYRESSETRIQVVLDLNGGTRRDITTGIPFFDHMLAQLSWHGNFNVGIQAEGDLVIDDHHTVEDIGIVLGQAFREAIGVNSPIQRYGSNHSPMDEALVLVALDISGRGILTFNVPFTRERLGGLATENVREFLRAFAAYGGITIHVHKIAGENDHHVCEAIFKGLGRAISEAIKKVDRHGPSSTKGRID